MSENSKFYGSASLLNVSANTVIKATAGRLVRVNVVAAGSDTCTLHDAATVASAGAANQVAAIPPTVGTYELNWPCMTGIVVKVASGQVVAISYS